MTGDLSRKLVRGDYVTLTWSTRIGPLSSSESVQGQLQKAIDALSDKGIMATVVRPTPVAHAPGTGTIRPDLGYTTATVRVFNEGAGMTLGDFTRPLTHVWSFAGNTLDLESATVRRTPGGEYTTATQHATTATKAAAPHPSSHLAVTDAIGLGAVAVIALVAWWFLGDKL